MATAPFALPQPFGAAMHASDSLRHSSRSSAPTFLDARFEDAMRRHGLARRVAIDSRMPPTSAIELVESSVYIGCCCMAGLVGSPPPAARKLTAPINHSCSGSIVGPLRVGFGHIE